MSDEKQKPGPQSNQYGQLNWKVVEARAFAWYVTRGWDVCLPLFKDKPYDFIVTKDGVMKRVNVKLASKKKYRDTYGWRLSSSCGGGTIEQTENRKARRRNFIDEYLAYLPDHKKFIQLPGDFLDDVCGLTRTIPQDFIEK